MEGLERIVMDHPAFRGLESALGAAISGCARNLRFKEGAYLFREGEPANEFFLIREGRVALEVHAPGQTPKVFATLGPGEIAGISWLTPPCRWTFDARVATPCRAIGINAQCLRAKCDADHHLGYELLKRFTAILIARLHATRLQMFDVYEKPSS